MTAMKARSIWVSGYRSVIDNGRGHSVVTDLPTADGGEDTGATALELAVMGLAGCVTTIFKKVAEKRNLEYSSLVVEVEAEKGEKTIEKCKVVLTIRTNASKEEVEKTLELTERICPVGILFEKAGVSVTWEIKLESA